MKIRRVKNQDIPWITRSIEKEKWGYLESDVKSCFDLEPMGCFIAEHQGESMGHAFSVIYRDFSWISLVIVDPHHREMGIASSLMERVLSYLDQHGPGTVYLEAVSEIAGLYRKFGFRDQFDSMRYLLYPLTPEKTDSNGIRSFQTEDLEEVIDFDSLFFGCPRARVIHRFLKDHPNCCFVKERSNKISGFIMARKTPKGFWIGPLSCDPDHPEDARSLIRTLIQARGDQNTEFRMGTPSMNQTAVDLISSIGFEKVGSSIRMVRGKEKGIGNMLGIFGIAGPEKG